MPGVLASVAAIVSVGSVVLAVSSGGIPTAASLPSAPALVTSTAGRSGAADGRVLPGSGRLVTVPRVAPPGGEQPAAAQRGGLPRSSYRWPLDPRPHVLRRFAVGPAPWSPGHRGVDLGARPRAPALAAAAGVVMFAGRIAGVGAVSVQHAGGIRTTYEPVTPDVRVGDRVTAGQHLGTVDSWPGHCPGPCLHWGALRGRTYLDPLGLLGLVGPVLLPVAR